MKLTRILLATWLVLTCFAGMAQITLKEAGAPLEKILAKIEQQSRYVFLYDADELNEIIITINIKNATLKETLEKCFKGLPVEFTVIGNNVLLKKKYSKKEKKPGSTLTVYIHHANTLKTNDYAISRRRHLAGRQHRDKSASLRNYWPKR